MAQTVTFVCRNGRNEAVTALPEPGAHACKQKRRTNGGPRELLRDHNECAPTTYKCYYLVPVLETVEVLPVQILTFDREFAAISEQYPECVRAMLTDSPRTRQPLARPKLRPPCVGETNAWPLAA